MQSIQYAFLSIKTQHISASRHRDILSHEQDTHTHKHRCVNSHGTVAHPQLQSIQYAFLSIKTQHISARRHRDILSHEQDRLLSRWQDGDFLVLGTFIEDVVVPEELAF
jgi:hypothetical protein